MDPTAVARYAATVRAARRERRTLDADRLRTDLGGPRDLDEAYRIQAEVFARRLADGERRVGWKLGYTSPAMREQMGVDAPNLGPLTDRMMLASGAVVPERVAQPRVEPEIALRLGRDLVGPVDVAEVLAATAAAHSCLEVVDSVWAGYRFRLEDNTADLSSAAFVVLGRPIVSTDLATVRVTMTRNGEHVGDATGAAASGHPAAGVAWLAGELAGRGESLRAGDLVITGGLLPAVPLEPGDVVSAVFDGGDPVVVRRG